MISDPAREGPGCLARTQRFSFPTEFPLPFLGAALFRR